jgi:hypothetical protein
MKNHFKLHFKDLSKEQIKANYLKMLSEIVEPTKSFWSKEATVDVSSKILTPPTDSPPRIDTPMFVDEAPLPDEMNGLIDIMNWNEVFNISSNFLNFDDNNIMPDYLNLFGEQIY